MGVLPSGDPDGVQFGLGVTDRLLQRGGCVVRDQPPDQVDRRLLERADRGPVGIALDPAQGRVWGRCRDPGQLEGTGVHPRSVAIAVRQEDRSIANDVVEQLATWDPARERFHRPAVTHDPLEVRMGGRVLRHGRDMVGRGAEAIEIAFDVSQPARDRMDVRIGEPREDRPSAKVDDPRSRAAKAEHGRIAPDRHNPVPGDCERGRRVGASAAREPIAIGRLHRPDVATAEDQVRRLVTHRRTVPATNGCRR